MWHVYIARASDKLRKLAAFLKWPHLFVHLSERPESEKNLNCVDLVDNVRQM